MESPCPAIGRMLQHAAPAPHRCQRRGKATAIIAERELVRLARRTVPKTTPPLTWGVCHNCVRSGVGAGIPHLVPGINTRNVPIDATALDKEGGNQR